jgi:hypothetical protein
MNDPSDRLPTDLQRTLQQTNAPLYGAALSPAASTQTKSVDRSQSAFA